MILDHKETSHLIFNTNSLVGFYVKFFLKGGFENFRVNQTKVISDMSSSLANMVIPYLLREKPESFFNSNTSQPRIGIVEVPSVDLAFVVEDNARFDIKFEQQTICRAADFVQGFTLMLALHYTFNVSYSEDILR